MLRFVLGLFMVLHGLVHLLYVGHSARRFELQAGMTWPDGAWIFSRFVGDGTIRTLASILCAVAAIWFVAGGAGIFASQEWWRPVIVGAAIFSTVLYVLFWDGTLHGLDDQGWIGILINLVILAALLVFKWPAADF
jgi:hypothetical protein